MTREQIERNRKWIEALRSGEYKQTQGTLRRIGGIDGKPAHCCLGVGCDLVIKMAPDLGARWNDESDNQFVIHSPERGTVATSSMPPYEVAQWFGWDGSEEPINLKFERDGKIIHANASELNDNERLSFEEIADVVEKYINEMEAKLHED